MVDQVEDFEPQFGPKRLAQTNALRQRGVDVELRWATERVALEADRTIDGVAVAVVVASGDRVHRQARGDHRHGRETDIERHTPLRVRNESMRLIEVARSTLGRVI